MTQQEETGHRKAIGEIGCIDHDVAPVRMKAIRDVGPFDSIEPCGDCCQRPVAHLSHSCEVVTAASGEGTRTLHEVVTAEQLIDGDPLIKSTDLLVASQVFLSMQLGFACWPLMRFTGEKEKMGEFLNPWWIKVLGWAVTLTIIALNLKLLFDYGSQWLASAQHV